MKPSGKSGDLRAALAFQVEVSKLSAPRWFEWLSGPPGSPAGCQARGTTIAARYAPPAHSSWPNSTPRQASQGEGSARNVRTKLAATFFVWL